MLKYLCLFLISVCFLIRVSGQDREIVLYYDNSGSMDYEENQGACEAVNYATQLLVSLLGENDKLTIFRTDGKRFEVPLNNKFQRDAFLAQIRSFECNAKMTPLEVLVDAINDINRSQVSEKWVIVFTDGDFEPTELKYRRLMRDWVDRRLIPPQLLLLINQDGRGNVSNFVKTDYTYNSSANYEDIINKLNLIGIDVLRISYKNQNLSFSEQGVQINTLLPLKRVLVVEQKAGSAPHTITSAKVGDNLLSWGNSFDISKRQKDANNTLLSGRITHISMGQNASNIPAESNISIEFDRPINSNVGDDLNDFQIYLEAAVSAKVDFVGLKGGGVENTFLRCPDTDEFTINILLENPDTGEPLPLSVLEDTEILMNGRGNEFALNPDKGSFQAFVKAEEEKMSFDFQIFNDDYLNIKGLQYQVIRQEACINNKLILETDLIEVKGNLKDLDQIPALEIKPVIQTPEGNIRLLRTEELRNIRGYAILENGSLKAKFKKGERGSAIVQLSTNFLCLCILKQPKNEIQINPILELPGELDVVPLVLPFKYEKLSFWGKCGNTIIACLFLIILLVYLVGILRKHRFDPNARISFKDPYKERELSLPLNTGFFTRWLVPFKPEENKIKGILFRANRNPNRVIIPKEVLNENMMLDGERLEKGAKRDEYLTQQKLLEVERGDGTFAFRFDRKRKSRRKKRRFR